MAKAVLLFLERCKAATRHSTAAHPHQHPAAIDNGPGNPGPMGLQGDMGLQGLQGEKWEKGERGLQGIAGPPGPGAAVKEANGVFVLCSAFPLPTK